MAVELIITSVRKGLDGGSGYQPVLRTRDLKPAIAERLQLRSGYSHPFPHGDRRNPVVYVHRIERVAGETLHVLARICDAGSDHTGRSNFLAHFVAMDDAEARRKPAGPAEVTRRMAFKTAWDEPAREADSPTVIGGDRQPGPCQAWKAAGLDPGLAGDLADAAMAGREVTLVSREGDDVLALFADALALVAPAKRWQVTFNTCRIEPFDGTWQAIRGDLPQAQAARSSPGVIDLTANPRGGNGPYAAYARGDKTTLPWQDAAKPVVSTTERSDRQPGDAQLPEAAGAGDGFLLPPVVATGGIPEVAPPRPKRRLAIPSDDVIPAEEDAGQLAVVGRRLMWLTFALVGVLPLAFAGVVLLWPDLLPDWATGSSVAAVTPLESNPASSSLDLGEAERERREREKARLAELERQEQKKQDEAKAAAEAQAKAEEEKQQQEDERRAQLERENQKRELDAKTKRAKQAFAALKTMPEIVVQDLVTGAGLGAPKLNDVDLGPFDIEALEEPGFALAIPKDVCGGGPFKAKVEDAKQGAREWKIHAANSPVEGGDAFWVHLATLTARDGNLHVVAAGDNATKYPHFNLLRRSVLLVKARDPSQPVGKGTVQRAIQLVRPVAVTLQRKVSLLESNKELLQLDGPTSTTVKPREGGDVPKLPSSSEISYEVRFDYPLQFKEGNPAQQPEVYRFNADAFCPLLECPPPNNSKPHERLKIGVHVKIDFAKGVIEIRPEVEGPGKDQVNLSEIAEFIKKTDRDFVNWLDREVAKVKSSVAVISKVSVAAFPKSEAQKRSRQLIANHRFLFEDFFQKDNLFPQLKDGKGNPTDNYTDRVERWIGFCDDILKRAEGGRGDAGALDVEWQKQMKEPLNKWIDRYAPVIKQQLEQRWKYLKPLNGSASIVVTRISSPAFNRSENDSIERRYEVKLVVPQDPVVNPQKKPKSDID
jgi:hypothetical protein